MSSEKDDAIDEDGSDNKVLEAELTNAFDRLSQQRETLREFSQEAMTIFRLILLLIGLPAAILGGLSPESLTKLGRVLLSNTCGIGSETVCLQIRGITTITGGLFVLAAGVNIAAAGYESRGVNSHTNPEDVVLTIQNEPSKIQYQRKRLMNSVGRIEHNNRIIKVAEQFLATGKVCLLFSTYLIATLAYIILSGSSVSVIYWLLGLVLYAIPLLLYSLYLPAPYISADRLRNQEPLYDRERVKEFIDKQDGEHEK